MTFLFKRNPKTPPELVKALNELVVKLDGTQDKKSQDECSRFLKQAKVILHGDDETEPQPDQIVLFANEVYNSDCLYNLIYNLKKLDFDSRKDVLNIFLTLLRRLTANKFPTVDYLIYSKPEIIVMLMKGPESAETGLLCGQLLRDCIKYEVINKFVLLHQLFWNFFRYVEIPIFEIATDSFITLHDLLTTHKKLVSDFLANNYEACTSHINKLIQSNNYVTKRQSVRLLSDLVLQRQNQSFLNKYFDDTVNLKLVMILLSDKLKNLQIEGFHIFKFFVAKPKKSQKVLDILIKNKKNFIDFFGTFDLQHFNDPNIIDERNYILGEIQKLPEIERI